MPTIEETMKKTRDLTHTLQYRITHATNLFAFAKRRGIVRANVFSADSGQIEVDLYDGNRMLEITLEADDSVTIAEDEGKEQVYFKERQSIPDAYQHIERFVRARQGQPASAARGEDR